MLIFQFKKCISPEKWRSRLETRSGCLIYCIYFHLRYKNNSFPLEPLFYEYGVDVLIFGHEHNYERMFPIYNYTYQVYTLKNVQVILTERCSCNREFRWISGVKTPDQHLNYFSGVLLPEQVQVWLAENSFFIAFSSETKKFSSELNTRIYYQDFIYCMVFKAQLSSIRFAGTIWGPYEM